MLLKLSKFFLYVSVFSVLVVMTSTFFPFIGGKVYFFRTAIQAALVFLLFWWGFEAREGEAWARVKDMFRKPLFAAVSVFFLVFMLAALFAYDFRAAFWSNYERGEGGFQMLHYYAFFFMLVFSFREKREWQILFWVSLAAATLMVLYGVGAAVFVSQPSTGAVSNPFGFVGPYHYEAEGPSSTFWGRLLNTERFQGSLGNPAYVAPYLVFSLFYLLWLWFSDKSKTLAKNISYGALAVFLTMFFWLAQTRGAFVGLVGAIFVFLVALFLGYPKLRKITAALIAGLAIVLAIGYYYRHSSFVKNIPGSRQIDIAVSDQTFQTRLWTWNSAWQGFKEKPILGWGPENFSAVFDKYFDSRHFVPDRVSETWFDYAHSVIFDSLAETGILGLLSFLAMFALFYWELFKKMNSGNPMLKALLAALPAGYFIQGLALFNVFPIYINLFLFMAFACYEIYYSSPPHSHHEPAHQAASSGWNLPAAK